jgi:hypothetical protein
MRRTILLPILSLFFFIAAPAAAQNGPVKDKRRLIPNPHPPTGGLQNKAQQQRQIETMTQRVQERARGMLRTKRPFTHKFKVYKRWVRRKYHNHVRRWRFGRNRHNVVTSASRSRRFQPWLSRQALKIRNRFMSSRLSRLRRVEGRRLRLPRGLGGLWSDMRNMLFRRTARPRPAPLNLGFSQLP